MRIHSVVPRLAALALVFSVISPFALRAQKDTDAASPAPKTVQPQASPIDWHPGPYTAQLGSVAEINVPAGFRFADAAGARRFMELTHNPPSDQEVGIITPILTKDDPDSKFYFVLFEFDDVGYVKDDEKSKIDADKLLESMQKGTEEGNKQRQARGWTPFHLTGWAKQPFYDSNTHNLTWATVGNSDDPKEGQTVNHSTRILGRHGVMRVDLVLDPAQVDAVVPSFNALLTGFHFSQGGRYTDFVKGDKVAEYGLTALIAGGATAIALKTGLFAKLLALLAGLWKVIAVAFAALLSRIKNIMAAIKKKFSRSSESSSDGGDSYTSSR